jgi:dihydroorotase
MSKNPSDLLKMNKGLISIGKDADVVLVDLNKKIVVDKDTFLSKGKNTPFHKREYYGKIVMTIKGGKVVYEGEKI